MDYIVASIAGTARALWESAQERLLFLPPFPDQIDTLALFSLLLVVGLLAGEWLRARLGWPKMVGYVLAGIVFGPSALNWISAESLAHARPIADAALGLLLMEAGRRLDLRWLIGNHRLLRATAADVALSFVAVLLFAWGIVGLGASWAAATAAVTMASAPAVVLLTVEESAAQGQVTERIILHTAIATAASFVLFTFVLGIVHAELSDDWANAVIHPLWVAVGATAIAWTISRFALAVAGRLPKRSLAQVFVLVAMALLAVGIARMMAVPVFLTLFIMGALLALNDRRQTLAYTALPEAHWLLAIILFVIVGASLPWWEFSWMTALQAIGLLIVRAGAKLAAVHFTATDLPVAKRFWIGIGIQPLSATAVFMAYEISSLYPEVGRTSLLLPLFAAAIMEISGPVLCRLALARSGEAHDIGGRKGGIA